MAPNVRNYCNSSREASVVLIVGGIVLIVLHVVEEFIAIDLSPVSAVPLTWWWLGQHITGVFMSGGFPA